MSHITTVMVKITDLDVLDDVCKSLELELRRQQKTYRTYGGRVCWCDAAIVDPDNQAAYEIGIVKSDKEYEVKYDGWQGGKGMMNKVGKQCSTLMQNYSLELAKKQARKLGWRWQEVKQEDGSIQLHCTPGRSW